MAKRSIFFRTANNYDRDEASAASGLACEAPTRTQQHFRDECDINNILRKFSVTGLLPSASLSPQYGDFSDIGDYHSCLNAIKAAEQGFALLPSHLRSRFKNDPAELIAFLDDPENREEAIKLGIIDSTSSNIEPVVPPAKPDIVSAVADTSTVNPT